MCAAYTLQEMLTVKSEGMPSQTVIAESYIEPKDDFQ